MRHVTPKSGRRAQQVSVLLMMVLACKDPQQQSEDLAEVPIGRILGCDTLEFTEEPELFGAVHSNGNRDCGGGAVVTLTLDSSGPVRVHEDSYVPDQEADPRFKIQFGWWDPIEGYTAGITGCSPPAGGITAYEQTGAYAPESHGHGGQLGPPWYPAGNGGGGGPKEGHCVRPGRYKLTVTLGTSSVTLPLDYLQVDHSRLVDGYFVESEVYNPVINAHDLRLRVDFPLNGGRNCGGQDHAQLAIDTASNLYKAPFDSLGQPTGTSRTRFRFRISGVTTCWLGDASWFSGGLVLARLFWDSMPGAENRSGYYDVDSYGPTVIRYHYFPNPPDTGYNHRVGLELRRPDETPASLPELFRTVHISRLPTDLVGISIAPARYSVMPGDTVTVFYQVKNVDTAAAEAPGWRARFYLSKDNILGTGDTFLGDILEPAWLKPGGASSEKITLTIPATLFPAGVTADSYYVFVHLDTLSPIPRTEHNATNNVKYSVAKLRVGASAYFQAEGDSVYRQTDQIFTATPLAGYVYRWKAGINPYTDWGPSNQYEHAGWNTNQMMTLQVKLLTDSVARDTYSKTIRVATQRLTLTGPSNVTSQTGQLYSVFKDGVPVAVNWFTREGPGGTWTLDTASSSTLTKSWSPGCYTSYVRAQDSTGAWLGRARMTVTVANQTPCN